MKNSGLKVNIVALMAMFFVFGFLAVAGNFANAQLSEQDIQNTTNDIQNTASIPSVDLDVSSSGRVGESVTVSAYTSNINDQISQFLWYLDDELDQTKSGVAKNTFTFITKKSNHVVRVVVMQDNKKIAENSILVSSYSVSLVWSANTYVPPEYEGKALPVRGSQITVTAIPNIKGFDPSELVYTWYLNADSKLRNIMGQDEFSFPVSISADSFLVFVDVSTPSGAVTVRQTLNIPVVRPSVLIYQKRSAGMSESASSNIFISPGETQNFIAKPYNFKAGNSLDFDYIWEFVNKTTEGLRKNPETLVLKIPDDSGYGQRYLTVTASNLKNSSERAQKDISVNIIKK